MSLASQDLAEVRAERLERERIELESRHDAEYELSLLGWYGRRLADLLDATKAQGEVMAENNDVRVRVEYANGQYTVTR